VRDEPDDRHLALGRRSPAVPVSASACLGRRGRPEAGSGEAFVGENPP
jgi:hypothetical protein